MAGAIALQHRAGRAVNGDRLQLRADFSGEAIEQLEQRRSPQLRELGFRDDRKGIATVGDDLGGSGGTNRERSCPGRTEINAQVHERLQHPFRAGNAS